MFWKRRTDDLRDEVQSYFEMLVDRGMAREEAEVAARVEIDRLERLREDSRNASIGTILESVRQDFRYAWRTMLKSPGFAAIANLTLALGIGVNTAIFSVVYAVLLKPLPYRHPEQLALIWADLEKSAAFRAPSSGTILQEIKSRATLIDDVAAMGPTMGTFIGETDAEQIKYAQVTTNFLSTLGVHAAMGRVFAADEEHDAKPAIVLCDSLWRRRFGADPAIIGKAVQFQGADRTVVGVLAAGFRLVLSPGIPSDVEAFAPFPGNIYKGKPAANCCASNFPRARSSAMVTRRSFIRPILTNSKSAAGVRHTRDGSLKFL